MVGLLRQEKATCCNEPRFMRDRVVPFKGMGRRRKKKETGLDMYCVHFELFVTYIKGILKR